jgi:hypothetical protein
VAAGIIIGGLTFAWNEEHTDFKHLYAEDNHQFFGDQLPPVWIHFGDLSEENADGETRVNEVAGFEIIIDRSSSGRRRIVRHELCHVATWGFETEVHGKQFVECMKRFE